MYFWKIDKLKEDLKKHSLSESESFKYLLATVILYAVTMIPFLENNMWDVLSAVTMGVLTVLEVLYVYTCNGGSKGKNFLERYFSLSWVLGIRWLVFTIPVMIVYFMAVQLVYKNIPMETTPAQVVFSHLLYIPYIWLLGKHMKEVARQK